MKNLLTITHQNFPTTRPQSFKTLHTNEPYSKPILTTTILVLMILEPIILSSDLSTAQIFTCNNSNTVIFKNPNLFPLKSVHSRDILCESNCRANKISVLSRFHRTEMNIHVQLPEEEVFLGESSGELGKKKKGKRGSQITDFSKSSSLIPQWDVWSVNYSSQFVSIEEEK